MPQYALLANPGHNRVYFEESVKLSVSELNILLSRASAKYSKVRQQYIAGIAYITFSTENPLTSGDLAILSRVSFAYAIFELKAEADGFSLVPIAKTDEPYMDTSVSTILKYKGKTNELFTRMMINLALFSSNFNDKTGLKLLDPVAGKGTTLFEGLISGFDVYGIEIGSKVANETYHYFKKYLETEKFKHTAKAEKINTGDKALNAVRYKFQLAKTKEDMKSNRFKTFELIAGNSVFANRYYRKNSFHVLVGDLPYGVQHGNVTNERQSSLTRNPRELLKACLPVWREVLMPGGTMALAWNTFVLPRDELVKLLEQAGFDVFNDGDWLGFEHRVDQAIRRDIVVARK